MAGREEERVGERKGERGGNAAKLNATHSPCQCVYLFRVFPGTLWCAQRKFSACGRGHQIALAGIDHYELFRVEHVISAHLFGTKSSTFFPLHLKYGFFN